MSTTPETVPEPNLAGMRVDYGLGHLNEEDLAADPFEQFGHRHTRVLLSATFPAGRERQKQRITSRCRTG